MSKDITINQLDPNTFEYQTYMSSDEKLIASSNLDTVFSSLTDYIEYYVYDQNQTLVYPFSTIPLVRYDVREGDVLLDPIPTLQDLGFDVGSYNVLYTFYRKRLASNISEKYFISEISSDRTEIRLDSNTIVNELIISSTNDFIDYRETAEYFVDFYLNFGDNQTIIANNVKLETDEKLDPTVLIKLYEPLPSNFNIKDELWVVELLSDPQAYEVNFVFEPEIEPDFTYIQGPNYSLDIVNQTATSGEQFSYSTLINSDITSSINQIQNLLNRKEINININYENYNNFVNFSSAKTRLENFYYKVELIESYTNDLNTLSSQITSNTQYTLAYSSSKAQLTGKIDDIVKNFDGYEYFLYFNSGSQFTYPKQNTEPPYKLYPTTSTEALTWVGSSTVNTSNYGGQALSASDYDQDNKDWLYWSIPEYLREDPANQKYELFVDMVGQYYDNVWVYTKDLTNKFNGDNRLDYGISKDLVADAIRDFAVKLYSNNFNTNDLFTAFLGLTPSGSAFPFPYMTGSVVDGSGDLAIPSGYEYVDTKISASNDIVPQDDVNKSLYKRIYHNIPYLLKTKGTISGIRALITSYGIPDTILRISEFGGKDRNESQDYDLKQNVFNYAFDTGASATNFVSSSLQANTKFPVQSGTNKARTIQLRFKSPTLPLPVNNVASSNIRPLQSLWSTDDSGGNLVLEYNGAGLISGSYSGSIPDPYDTYGTLKWIPAEEDDPNLSASVYLPFFNGDWWSVQMNVNDVTASLYAANEIDGKIGFNESSSTVGFDDSFYYESTIGYLNKDTNVVFDDGTTYTPFSGSFQELRYYVNEISQSRFYDYTVNPYSNEGNGINSTPDQQFFRAALGTQLDTGSRTSIHPRVTGSAVQITQSFATDSEFYINSSRFITNVEDIFQDQVPAGIKNRITDKIYKENLILAEAPYGVSGSIAVNSSDNNDTTTISALKSIQQQSFVSQSYTPSINYLEVAFSPSNQINDDINAQLGYFNLGDYIGDPRFISSSDKSYPDLDRLRDAYFEKYMASYDIVDFIRLIKFFDNSLFKMIKDFTPARTSLSSGVVVKQHLLERNRQRPAQVTSSFNNYSGSIKPFPKDYNTGSSDQPQYATSGSAIYKFSGGPGGVMNRYNGLQTSPSASVYGLTNQFGPLTQSYDETLSGPLGQEVVTIFNQDEFYNGEFSGSSILVQNGNLNPGCDIYLDAASKPVSYFPIFFNTDSQNYGITSVGSFNDILNYPAEGYVWILSVSAGSIFTNETKYIKIASRDINGNNIGDYIDSANTLDILFFDADLPGGKPSTEYSIVNSINNGTHVLIEVSNTQGDYTITGSSQGGSEQFSVIASGSYTGSLVGEGAEADLKSQNNFTGITAFQSQIISFWGEQDGTVNIPEQPSDLKWFNPGAKDKTSNTLLNSSNFISGSYLLERTPNVPLFFSGSFAYSASDLNLGAGGITSSGIYMTGSYYQAGVNNQDFTLNELAANNSGSYFPTPTSVELGANFFSVIPSGNPTNGIPFINQDLRGNERTPNDLGAGNSQIIQAGTASINFEFPTFTFTQEPNTTPAPVSSKTPFSGSDFSIGSIGGALVANEPFTGTESSLPNAGYVDADDSGKVTFKWTDFSGSAPTVFPLDLLYSLKGQATMKLFVDPSDYNLNYNFTEVGFIIDTTYDDGTTPFINIGYNRPDTSYPIYVEPSGIINDANAPFIEVILDFNIVDGIDNAEIGLSNALNPEITITPFFNTDMDFNTTASYWIEDLSVKIEQCITSDFVYQTITYGPFSSYNSNYSTFSYYYFYDQRINNISSTSTTQPLVNGAQGDSSNISFLKPITNLVNQQGNSADVRAILHYSSSTRDHIITQSNDVAHIFGWDNSVNTTLTETISFPDNPISNIRNENPATINNTQSTINEEDSMYYVSFEFVNFASGPLSTQASAFNNISYTPTSNANLTPSPNLLVEISNELKAIAESPELTASLYVQQGNTSNTSTFGSKFTVDSEFLKLNTINSTGRVDVSGALPTISFNTLNTRFSANDTLRFGLDVEKTFGLGLKITEYSMSISPSSSRWSPFTGEPSFSNYRVPTETGIIIPTFYGNGILPFNFALDCQPLLNNYNEQRQSSFLMNVDYSSQSGPIIPVNQSQILSNSAVRASIPDSNYSQLKSIIPRYLGSKSTSKQLNEWNIGDVGTFGKLPTIELRDAFFGYFNDISDPYPNINEVTRVNLNYLIDEQGNALPPSLEPLTIDTFKSVFPTTTLGRLAIKSGKAQYKDLGGPAPIESIMRYVTPVIYTQISAQNYLNRVPLSGSGFISQYDNGDENDALFARFTAMGSASIETGFATQSVDYYLDPTSAFKGYIGNDIQPYQTSSNISPPGVANYNNTNTTTGGTPTPSIINNKDLPSSQIVSVQTSFVTSFVSETNRVGDELQFDIHMYTDGSNSSGEWIGSKEKGFNLEDIQCKVYTEDERVTNLGSVMGYGWFQIINIVNYYTVRRRTTFWSFFRRWRFQRWRYSQVAVPSGGIKCTVDWEMYNTLFDLGLMRERASRGSAGVLALEWIITMNSGVYTIKGNDAISWRINGFFKNSRGGFRQGFFFPQQYSGAQTSVNIQGQGANDYLAAEDNTAAAPFWVPSSAVNDATFSVTSDPSILVMSSSNMNEAYGTTFRQADLEYQPGPSDYFPLGLEPANTQFDRIESTIELKENDEIRFANNENFTYRIINVFTPQENVVGGKARLKIQVDRPIDQSLNFDFFLVRRPTVNPNTLFLDIPFPYESLSSASITTAIRTTGSSGVALSSSALIGPVSADGSYSASMLSLETATTPGILYPDYPTQYLIESASIIVNDLVSKGIIES